MLCKMIIKRGSKTGSDLSIILIDCAVVSKTNTSCKDSIEKILGQKIHSLASIKVVYRQSKQKIIAKCEEL